MTNFEVLHQMPLPVMAEWLCSINKCETCWFKDKKEECMPARCTWYWLNNQSDLPIATEKENERSEQNP